MTVTEKHFLLLDYDLQIIFFVKAIRRSKVSQIIKSGGGGGGERVFVTEWFAIGACFGVSYFDNLNLEDLL